MLLFASKQFVSMISNKQIYVESSKIFDNFQIKNNSSKKTLNDNHENNYSLP